MVTSTYVVNSTTVRTWQEPRGLKTLTRRFVLQYRVNAICNGKWYSVSIYPTLAQAISGMRSTMKKVDAKYGVKDWADASRSQFLTHVHECGFWCSSGGEKSVKVYITEECKPNGRISETVDERPIIMVAIKRDGEGHRIPWVYAHGRFEDDLGSDLFCTDLNGESVHDGMKAFFEDKEVVFHLYRNEHGMMTGVATYADDEEACAYGRRLVAEKPRVF